MAHWLFKSEPSAWSFDRLERLGAAGTDWSGVRNHSAKLNMQAMKVGEQGFFYHSNEGKAIVGIVVVCKAYRHDPTDPSGKFGWSIFAPFARCRARSRSKRPKTTSDWPRWRS